MNRVFKNWKTSLAGLIILIGSLVVVGLGKATLLEAGGFIVAAGGFFLAKDPKSGQQE